MLIVMDLRAREEDIQRVVAKIESLGFRANPIPGEERIAIGITGNAGRVDPEIFRQLPGVLHAVPVSKPFKLVSLEVKPEPTIVRVGEVAFGGARIPVIAGPCAVEGRERLFAIAAAVKDAGASMLRGGAYKPRTSPYSFQGLGEEGLKLLAEARERTGLPVVTEAVDVETLPRVAEYADMVQIGARNMQNFSLLRRAGRLGRPVLLKRGMAATLDDLLLAAEYILSEGNYDVVVCERGIKTFLDHMRNTSDLSIVPAWKRLSHLPIIVDPSHATGQRDMVTPVARAAVAIGADGLMIEVHDEPEAALSDGPQCLTPGGFRRMMEDVRRLAEVLGRSA